METVLFFDADVGATYNSNAVHNLAGVNRALDVTGMPQRGRVTRGAGDTRWGGGEEAGTAERRVPAMYTGSPPPTAPSIEKITSRSFYWIGLWIEFLPMAANLSREAFSLQECGRMLLCIFTADRRAAAGETGARGASEIWSRGGATPMARGKFLPKMALAPSRLTTNRVPTRTMN